MDIIKKDCEVIIMRNNKKLVRKIVAITLAIVVLLSFNMSVFASSQVATFQSYQDGFATPSFYISSGYIYLYLSLTSKQNVYPDTSYNVGLYSVDNNEFYSFINVTMPAYNQTKNTTLHWHDVPNGNYRLSVRSQYGNGTTTIASQTSSGTVYDGPK